MNRSLFWPPFWLPLRTAPSSKLPWLLGLLGRNLLAICTRPLYTVFSFLGQIEAYIIPILQHQKVTQTQLQSQWKKQILYQQLLMPSTYSTRNRRRHSASLRWSTHFSSMHGCMFPTYSTRKYPKHSDSQSWGTNFHYFPTIFYGALPTYSTKKHLSGNHSILQHQKPP